LIEVMEQTDAKDESYKAKLTLLCELVDHHVKEEESTLFKMAKQLFSKEELEELGAQMEAEKEELEAGA
ncbi:MAG: hemerythrin domain-containing protein, partial [Candidatus Eremiobacteraeota bacterium]|nr:hemerythrin domain-containing protein [Candidatus Eremiobacteraeota bacterium]